MFSAKKVLPSELQAANKIQDWTKLMISRQKTARQSALDLGKNKALDIAKRSKQNLRSIKVRLGQLSPEEKLLFKVLLNKNLIAPHTTSAPLLEHIFQEDKPQLIDPSEAKRRDTVQQTVTPNFSGINNNIFLSLAGSPLHSLPNFTRQRFNIRTKKIEDYATVRIDLQKYIQTHPHSGIWSGGHYSKYENALAGNQCSNSIMLAGTEFYCEYKVENPYSETKRRYFNRLTFVRIDGSKAEQEIEIGDEIATDGDLLPFFAYAFIERLRHVGGVIQQEMLASPDNHQLIDLLIEKLFRADHFEIHIPTKIDLQAEYITHIFPQERKEITQAVSQAAADGDISRLEELKTKNYPLDGYMYHDGYIYDNSEATMLPMVTAIKAGKVATIRWLIANGASRAAFKNESNEVMNAVYEKDLPTWVEGIMILSSAFACGNLEILELLVEKGFNFNLHFELVLAEEVLKSSAADVATLNTDSFSDENKKNEYEDLKYTDNFFLTLLGSAVEKNYADAKFLLDSFYNEFSYCQQDEFIEKRLFQDVARVGNEIVFTYFKQKHPLVEINYRQLFDLAMMNNNSKIIAFLYPLANEEKAEYISDVASDDSSVSCCDKEIDLRQLVLDKLQEAASQENLNFYDVIIAVAECLLRLTIDTVGSLLLREDELALVLYVKNVSDKPYRKLIEWMLKQCGPEIATPKLFFHAIKFGAHETAKWLLDENFISVDEINQLDQGVVECAVTRVLYTNKIVFAEYLISKGLALPNNSFLYTWAMEKKFPELFQWLLEKNISKPENIANEALEKCSRPMLEALEKAGVILPVATKLSEKNIHKLKILYAGINANFIALHAQVNTMLKQA